MEQIECSEMSAYINQTPGNHPKENKQHSEHGESLKSRKIRHNFGLEVFEGESLNYDFLVYDNISHASS